MRGWLSDEKGYNKAGEREQTRVNSISCNDAHAGQTLNETV